jgi:hypothetical protein
MLNTYKDRVAKMPNFQLDSEAERLRDIMQSAGQTSRGELDFRIAQRMIRVVTGEMTQRMLDGRRPTFGK